VPLNILGVIYSSSTHNRAWLLVGRPYSGR